MKLSRAASELLAAMKAGERIAWSRFRSRYLRANFSSCNSAANALIKSGLAVHVKIPWDDGYLELAEVKAAREAAAARDARIKEAAGECFALLKDLCDSFECYVASEKAECDYDEYDYMMLPRWKKAREIIARIEAGE